MKKNENENFQNSENFNDTLDEMYMGDIDEWKNDDDAGYIYVSMSEADFFEMVEEVYMYRRIFIYTICMHMYIYLYMFNFT